MSTIIVPRSLGQPLNLGYWPTKNLVFYWRGIPAGNAVDESLFRNHGTIIGATWVGDALDFDGTEAYVDVGPANQIMDGTDLTFLVWIKPSVRYGITNQGFLGISDLNAGLNFYMLSGGFNIDEFRGMIAHATTDATVESATNYYNQHIGVWFHLVYVYDSSSKILSLYINGVNESDSQVAGVGNRDDFSGPFKISSIAYGISFNGQINNVMIYNRALSASEIAALYINPDLPMQQEPVWLFSPTVTPGGIVVLRRRRECA